MDKGELIKGLLIIAISYVIVDNFKYYDERPVVEVENGKIRGIFSSSVSYQGRYVAFMGIPYAKPPINDLRFEPPEPAENWTDIRDAGYFRSQCISVDILFSGLLFGDEDCLVLNVFVPLQLTSNKLAMPVMVFFHGGYWHLGSSQDHGEKRFMHEDVVLVTANYRLGALGFLSTGDRVVRGNQGLKDQIMVLKWVQRNIARFGGDPNRVTIFGESVGAVSVHLHILSPASRGLFHKAISQSGTALNMFAINRHPKDQAKRFAAKFQCPSINNQQMINCLKKVDAGKLVTAHKEAVDLFNRDRLSMFAATIETVNDSKAFLVEEPLKILERGDFPKIPWITGVNVHEGYFASAAIFVNETKQNVLKKWRTGLPALLWYDKVDKISEKIQNFYFGSTTPSISKEEYLTNVTESLSDRAFFHPISQCAKLYSKHAETYLYYFNYKGFFSLENFFTDRENYIFHPSLSILFNQIWRALQEFVLGWPVISKGSCHGDELPLLFTLPWTPHVMSMLPERDEQISKNLVRLWAAFAKSWDSLVFDKVTWEPVNSTRGPLRYLEISERPAMINEPFTDKVQFWESIENDLLK